MPYRVKRVKSYSICDGIRETKAKNVSKFALIITNLIIDDNYSIKLETQSLNVINILDIIYKHFV
jgi:hypothetical protein